MPRRSIHPEQQPGERDWIELNQVRVLTDFGNLLVRKVIQTSGHSRSLRAVPVSIKRQSAVPSKVRYQPCDALLHMP